MNPISNHHPLGDANVYHFTSFLVNVMFLFLVNTVKLTPGLCRLLPVVFELKIAFMEEIEDSINARLILD